MPFDTFYDRRHAIADEGQRVRRGVGESAAAPAIDLKELHPKIGQLALENDLLEGALTKAGVLSAKR